MIRNQDCVTQTVCGLVTGVVRNVNFTCVTQVLDPAKACKSL